MMRRCYSETYQNRQKTYKNCEVHPIWHNFSNFYQWWCEQEPPEGWELDKDFINFGNQVYTPENCVFVEKRLNSFLAWQKRDHGDLPLGVSYHKRDNVYTSSGKDIKTNKPVHLGYFIDPIEAHNAFRIFKWKQAQEWIDRIEKSPYYKKKKQLINALKMRYEIKDKI